MLVTTNEVDNIFTILNISRQWRASAIYIIKTQTWKIKHINDWNVDEHLLSASEWIKQLNSRTHDFFKCQKIIYEDSLPLVKPENKHKILILF